MTVISLVQALVFYWQERRDESELAGGRKESGEGAQLVDSFAEVGEKRAAAAVAVAAEEALKVRLRVILICVTHIRTFTPPL